MSNKNLGKTLTRELVFSKTKLDNLNNVKNLNVWGSDLEDLSIIEAMPNLEILSLSVNKISTLSFFSSCAKLHELYLRKNSISDIREIRYLVNLPELKILWLHDNPCADVQDYREIVIKFLPNLVKLDNHAVTPEERAQARNMNFDLPIGKEQTENDYRAQSQNNSKYKEDKWQKPSSGYSNNSSRNQPQPQSQHLQSHHDFGEQEENQYKEKRNSSHAYYKEEEKKVSKSKYAREEDINRNQNILMAVLSLLRELDSGSLEIVRREADKMLR